MIVVSSLSLLLFIVFNVFFKLNDIVIYAFLVSNLIICIKEFKYVRNKFYLERIIYDNYYNAIISNSSNIEDMRIDKYYYYKVGDRYVNERKYIIDNR
jgi:hypothetical protein